MRELNAVGRPRRRGSRRRRDRSSCRRTASCPPPASERIAEPGLPLEPKPPRRRSEPASSSTSIDVRRLDPHEHAAARCGRRAATANARLAVGVEQQHLHLAAVAGVDQAGRVDERDPVPGGESRARAARGRRGLRGSRPRSRSGPSALAGREHGRPRARAGRARHRRRRPGSAAARGRPAAGPAASRRARAAERECAGSARRRAPAAARCTRTPSGVSSRSRSPASVVQLGEPRRRRRRGSAARRPAASRANSSSMRSLERVEPLAGDAPRSARRPGAGARARRAARRRSGRPWRGPGSAAPRRRRSRPARRRPRAIIASSSSSGTEASTTWRIRSASRVSSSVAPNASTSWWGSLRMNPTVSVSEVVAAAGAQQPRGRVERVEQPVADADARRRSARSAASTCRRSCSRRARPTAAARARARRASPRGSSCTWPSLRLQRRDPVAREPAVGLDLRLTGSSGADAAVDSSGAEPLQVRPQPAHAREVVLELGELDLELALGGVGVRRRRCRG